MQGSQARIGAALLAAALALFMSVPSSAQTARQPAAKLGAAKPAAPVRGEGIAALVNDEVISTLDLRQRAALILVSSGMPVTAENMQQVRGQALRDLIDEAIQVQEAKEREIKPRDSDIDEAIQRIAKSNEMSVTDLSKQLNQAGAGMGTLRRQLNAEILWRRLISARYGSRVRVSQEEINDTLKRIEENASKPQYRLAEILLMADTDKEKADARKVADRLLREMRAGRASFAAVARQFSGAPSAAAGGDLGWLSEGELRPELVAATRALKAGQVSEPLNTEFGVLIIAMREMRNGVDTSRAMKVRLRQVSAPVGSRDALERAKARIRGCDSIANAVKNVPDARVTDLGDMIEADLADNLKAKVAETPQGGASGFIEAGGTVSTIVVCQRASEGGIVPSREEVEDRLFEQEMGMLSQRYLTDLKREATIITR